MQAAFRLDGQKLYFDFVRRERFPFIAGWAVPEMYQRFEMAAAAAVHERFLQLAADNVAHHVGIGFPLRVEFGQVQPQQAVHAVQIGLGADEFQNGLRSGLLTV